MASDRLAQRLRVIYEILYESYGPQSWWPADEAFEVVVGAILTQSTAWVNVEQAIANLKRAGTLDAKALIEMEEGLLAELIRPSGYFNQKAKKLKAFVGHLADHYGADLSDFLKHDVKGLREELLGIFGIGPETADSIILYASEQPIFVVDAYTKRVFSHLGLVRQEAAYDELQRLFMDHLPADVKLFNEYHALIVRHGKLICRKEPACDNCILGSRCAFRLEVVERAS